MWPGGQRCRQRVPAAATAAPVDGARNGVRAPTNPIERVVWKGTRRVSEAPLKATIDELWTGFSMGTSSMGMDGVAHPANDLRDLAYDLQFLCCLENHRHFFCVNTAYEFISPIIGLRCCQTVHLQPMKGNSWDSQTKTTEPSLSTADPTATAQEACAVLV